MPSLNLIAERLTDVKELMKKDVYIQGFPFNKTTDYFAGINNPRIDLEIQNAVIFYIMFSMYLLVIYGRLSDIAIINSLS